MKINKRRSYLENNNPDNRTSNDNYSYTSSQDSIKWVIEFSLIDYSNIVS